MFATALIRSKQAKSSKSKKKKFAARRCHIYVLQYYKLPLKKKGNKQTTEKRNGVGLTQKNQCESS
jgi:hypothetical protein